MWEISGKRILVDPWFTESQVDLAPWFSEQFHLENQISVSELGNIDYIFISHPFTDHCNKETLLQLDKRIPLVSRKKNLNKIKKWQHFESLIPIDEFEIEVDVLPPKSKLDLVHFAYHFKLDNDAFLYAPHGATFKNHLKTDLLITTSVRYKLPFWLGGIVNLGIEEAINLKNKLGAPIVLTTHDEKKIGKGLVEKFAKKHYPIELPEGFVALKTNESYPHN